MILLIVWSPMSSLSIFHYNKVWEQELDSFCRKSRKDNNKSSFIPFKYQGQYEDIETGLYYNRFRYYDSCTGNYISQDPIGLSGGDNLYSYVQNPTICIDTFVLSGQRWMGKTKNRHSLIAYVLYKCYYAFG